ncbi:molybdopterin-guanine dinucleotide biosynthesis protein A [Saonia flava]|uniref:Probable molybdenum cofactor guanylyltransferase n=1 Tax=Saonia flava TaxID=523696 RepID=A0A846QLN2_9FLAO|nr:NTP transferase domain-containing protein [Saonia flava]NJB69866.1 molybdopterin-guanine dinucleotide biosynthesis protein A [Saonia flava]
MKDISKLYGLVLSGGKSTRMGEDKGAIKYHGIPQREYLYNLLSEVCDKTFISIRSDQKVELSRPLPFIEDLNEYKGPYNGILSAHKAYPEVAWLVIACDIPLLDIKSLKQLISNRLENKNATAFATKKSSLPEPLAAIWEPKGLIESIEHLKNGTSTCPRKFLINSEIAIVYPDSDEVLINANSKEEYEQVVQKLAAV